MPFSISYLREISLDVGYFLLYVFTILRSFDGIFQGFFRRFFVTFLPFSIMASYPTKFLIENNSLSIFFEIALSSSLVYILVAIIWRWGLKSYSSASS